MPTRSSLCPAAHSIVSGKIQIGTGPMGDGIRCVDRSESRRVLRLCRSGVFLADAAPTAEEGSVTIRDITGGIRLVSDHSADSEMMQINRLGR